jgi:hypothetical protein
VVSTPASIPVPPVIDMSLGPRPEKPTRFIHFQIAGLLIQLGGLLLMWGGPMIERPCTAQQRVASRLPVRSATPALPEHPLAAPLRWARHAEWKIDNEIRDYTCTLIMRKGQGEHEQVFLKIRHQPFSIYMYFVAPAKIRGREVLYVEGRDNGRFLAHEGRGLKSLVGSIKLQVSRKYPLEKLGIRYLNQRLIQLAEEEMQLGKCQVRFYPEAKVGNQEGFCVQVQHPVRQSNARVPLARAVFDKRYGFPFRYEGYVWPQRENAAPVLDEEYTYVNLRFNVGLTDWDFDRRNPAYSF